MCILPTSYLAPVSYYALLFREGQIQEEHHESFQKQSLRSRCLIAGPAGIQSLSIPIEKGSGAKQLTKDVRLSDHGDWRRQHWNSLETAYGSSPFFEYYADDLQPFYEKKWHFLVDYNEALARTISELIGIPYNVQPTNDYIGINTLLDIKHPDHMPEGIQVVPYYQVFSQRHGFHPGLSIVDLLFNMGPEGILVLKAMQNHL